MILHFACHGDESAWSLFEQDLAAQDLEKFIASWTASGKRLRVVIANACNSNHIAQALSKYVDFVIGHATTVRDEDAVAFARELYGYVGAGDSLGLDFDAAKIVSNPYCMAGLKNAANFKLTQPSISSTRIILGVEPLAVTTVDLHVNALESSTRCMDPDELNAAHCNELIRFLKDEGLISVAARFSEQMGMELISNLQDLHEEDLDDPEFSFLR